MRQSAPTCPRAGNHVPHLTFHRLDSRENTWGGGEKGKGPPFLSLLTSLEDRTVLAAIDSNLNSNRSTI